MCMYDDGGPPAVYRSRIQRTRKERRCYECGRKITIGESYQNAILVYEGHRCTFATCEHCQVAMAWLSENCGGYVHGGVWKDLEEHIGQFPTLAYPLSRLKVGRQRMWERFDRTGLMAIAAVPPSLEERGLT